MYAYLVDTGSKGDVYLSDGPLEYLLIAVVALPANTSIFINSNNPQKRLFFKHFVLNNLEIVQEIHEDEL